MKKLLNWIPDRAAARLVEFKDSFWWVLPALIVLALIAATVMGSLFTGYCAAQAFGLWATSTDIKDLSWQGMANAFMIKAFILVAGAAAIMVFLERAVPHIHSWWWDLRDEWDAKIDRVRHAEFEARERARKAAEETE